MFHRHRSLLLGLLIAALSSATAHSADAPESAPSNADASAESNSEASPPDATEAPPAPTRTPLAERSQAQVQALEQQLEAKQQQHLQGADEQFLALWLPANVAEPSGVVVLLPGSEDSADAPNSVGPLRRKLADGGWHSLSLSLPSPGRDIPLPRPVDSTPPAPPAETTPADSAAAPSTAEEQTPDAATAHAPEAPTDSVAELEQQRSDYSKRLIARIDAGVKFAAEQKAPSITLLGYGSGAYWAARYLQEHKEAPVAQLIVLEAQLPSGYQPPLEESLPALQRPTVDLYDADTLQQAAALKRLQASKRLKHPSYTQIKLKTLEGNPQVAQEQVYRRVRGWLSEQGKEPKAQ